MSDMVWISKAPMNLDRGMRVGSDPIPGSRKCPSSFLARNDRGEPLGSECFPRVLWTLPAAERDHKVVPALFQSDGGFVVSSKCADVLHRFDGLRDG